MVKSRIKTLTNQVEKVTKMMITLKTKSPEIDEAVNILTSTKGVGDNTALSHYKPDLINTPRSAVSASATSLTTKKSHHPSVVGAY